ncbi:MAG TPA: acetate--CoA ligase family protein [Burkholderiales bacterium]|nr:acetate--CoA ligase family protein [Burkholderiales bacterium]
MEKLLNPRSIAIVGASDKIGPGFNAWKALEHVGYQGRVYFVNPNRPELLGQKAYPSLRDIDGEIDAVFVAVKAESVQEVAVQAVEKRAGGMAILSSGFGDAGEAGVKLQNELAAFAEKHGLAVCGPNCLGLLNFSGRSALFGTSLPDAVKRGGIAAIVQSGSIGIALLNSGRGLGLSHLVTSGNEAVTATADYLEAFIDDSAVSAIIVFAEQLRKPKKFIAMARRATEKGKPVIVLKSGRSEPGRAAVMAHTGAVAGSVEACDAALAASGVLQVFSLDELLETAALVSQLRTKPQARKIAALSLSGGEIALALDAAEENGIVFAPLGAAEGRIKPLLPEFAHLSNPLDLTWAGLYDFKVAEGCARALGGLEDVGTLVLLQDAPTGLGAQQAGRYSTLLQAVARGAQAAGKPLVAVSNLSDPPHPELERVARESGVPYLRGTREGLAAIARYAQWATRPASPSVPTSSREKESAKPRLQPFKTGRLPAEHEARNILESYGIAGPQERFVATAEEAAQAAATIGFPVVLKGLVADMLHKSDAGLVKLRLTSADEVRDAAQKMISVVKSKSGGKPVLGLLVQKMMSPVAEILVGARVDPDFGPLIVVGGGGITVELYRDVAIRVAPLDESEALAALASTRVSRILDGWRGAPAGDKLAAAKGISAISRFIADFADEVGEVEINPFAVLEEGRGCLALDCVIVPHSGD